MVRSVHRRQGGHHDHPVRGDAGPMHAPVAHRDFSQKDFRHRFPGQKRRQQILFQAGRIVVEHIQGIPHHLDVRGKRDLPGCPSGRKRTQFPGSRAFAVDVDVVSGGHVVRQQDQVVPPRGLAAHDREHKLLAQDGEIPMLDLAETRLGEFPLLRGAGRQEQQGGNEYALCFLHLGCFFGVTVGKIPHSNSKKNYFFRRKQ